ncbi:MAG: acyl-CoA dehydrogenase family protein, partial [Firmicutes bacterium]|nr:acyl-CoA dehydrogenase family protein [Bacillota bacterium]
MGGELDADTRLVQDAILRLVNSTIQPRSAEYDANAQFPRANLTLLAEQGFMAMTAPVEYGGAGLSYLAQTVVVEALAFGCPATAVIYEVHNSLHTEAVWRYGTDAQKANWIPKLSDGTAIGAFALTEAEAGSDAADLSSMAYPVAGGYRLTGRKMFISSAGEAERYLVFARLPATAGREGITAFMVDRDTPGVSFGRPLEKMGLHASKTAEMVLEDVFVAVGDRLGSEGQGYEIALTLLDGGRIGIAAQACGMLAAALARSRRYAMERKQFGQPISRFEGVQFKLADMATDLYAARLMTYEAARRRNDRDIRVRAAMAKVFASEAVVRHALAAIQVHGGYG